MNYSIGNIHTNRSVAGQDVLEDFEDVLFRLGRSSTGGALPAYSVHMLYHPCLKGALLSLQNSQRKCS